MTHFPGPWWIGGGWAIDLWLGSQIREHEDIEVCVLRHNQDVFRTYCAEWQFFTPRNDQWAPMADDELLVPPHFMLQFQQTPATVITVEDMQPVFEFLLNDVADDGQWIFLPEPSIRVPLDQIHGVSPLHVPVTMPEIILLHKALYVRPKDEHDFQRVLPHLGATRRAWLAAQFARIRPRMAAAGSIDNCPTYILSIVHSQSEEQLIQ
jgi:hypothetical protein